MIIDFFHFFGRKGLTKKSLKITSIAEFGSLIKFLGLLGHRSGPFSVSVTP